MQIKIENLSYIFDYKSFNEYIALKNINLTFEQGEFTAIIGHTGSGKTTLIEHFNGLRQPTFGEIVIGNNFEDSVIIDNAKINKKQKRKILNLRKKIGIVFQFAENQLFEETIEKDIIFGPINLGVPKEKAKELAKKYLTLVGLEERFLTQSPFDLSGGQKRRVAIAGILAMEPDVLIFDEPTAGLDPEGTKDVYQIFEKLNQEDKTIIIVTHDLDHVLKHTKRTIVLRKGEVVKDGKTEEVLFDRDFLIANELEPPKLVSFINELEACSSYQIGRLHTTEQLAKKIKENWKQKGGE